jgi:hypothetical protein
LEDLPYGGPGRRGERSSPFNAKGFDLNRNWDTIDAALMPEIAAQHAAIESGSNQDDPSTSFSLHNTETSEYLQGPPGEMPQSVSAFSICWSRTHRLTRAVPCSPAKKRRPPG